jgi:pilus assembly protein Flp/PilA
MGVPILLILRIPYIRQFLRLKLDQRAVTAIEYALIAALIAVVIVGAATTLGTHVSSTFNKISSEL